MFEVLEMQDGQGPGTEASTPEVTPCTLFPGEWLQGRL